jgi:hypothetical protein
MLFVEACEGAASRYVTQLYKGLAAFCSEKNSIHLGLTCTLVKIAIVESTYGDIVIAKS